MVRKVNNKLKESMLKENADGVKIFADTCYIDALVDSYEEGEGEFITSWTIDLLGEYDNLQEIIDELCDNDSIYSNDLNNYVFLDGRLCSDVTTNSDYEKPSEDELERFRNSEIDLCVLHIDIPLEVGMKPHTMTEEEAEKYGVEVY